MKKLFIGGAIFLLLIVGIVVVLRFFVGGPEDNWICQGGSWVKHGNPSAPMPTGSCGPAVVQNAKSQLENSSVCYSPNGNSMSFADAKEKATSGCLDGALQDNHICNTTTGTWWIDFTPNNPKEGCNPACVVNVETGEAEINWRCGGYMEPSM